MRTTVYSIDQTAGGISHVACISEFDNGDFVYFTIHMNSPPTNTFDPTADATVNLGSSATPTGAALYNNLTSALISNSADDTAILRDGGTSLPNSTTIDVGDDPNNVVVDETMNEAFTANITDHTVSTINLGDNSVTSSHTGIGIGPDDLAIDTTNGFLITINGGDNSVSILNLN